MTFSFIKVVNNDENCAHRDFKFFLVAFTSINDFAVINKALHNTKLFEIYNSWIIFII